MKMIYVMQSQGKYLKRNKSWGKLLSVIQNLSGYRDLIVFIIFFQVTILTVRERESVYGLQL